MQFELVAVAFLTLSVPFLQWSPLKSLNLKVTSPTLVTAAVVSEKSPYYQHLPDCSKADPKLFVQKRHKYVKGLVCPMVSRVRVWRRVGVRVRVKG